jgi:hypothetical protein
MKMDEREVAQIFLEFKEAQGQALAILTQALCQQIDPVRLKDALQDQISAAKKLPSISKLAIDMATHAMAAAEAEKMLQAKPLSEGPYPKR